jgi:SNF2 family DNA or RNA helicase
LARTVHENRGDVIGMETFKKIAIMSTSLQALANIRKGLIDMGIISYFYVGDTSAVDRTDILSKFNNEFDSVKVLLLSEECGGTGTLY